jgi:DNA-directed RNA polymerase specialized sigma24 family protein
MSTAEIEALYRDHARRPAEYLMRATSDPDVAADLTAETRLGRTARIDWLGENGTPSSRGIPLLPPVTASDRR